MSEGYAQPYKMRSFYLRTAVFYVLICSLLQDDKIFLHGHAASAVMAQRRARVLRILKILSYYKSLD